VRTAFPPRRRVRHSEHPQPGLRNHGPARVHDNASLRSLLLQAEAPVTLGDGPPCSPPFPDRP
jgi:hypothetical protein